MLQTFQYQNSPITFDFDGEVMVNATQMAKPFGKVPNDFLRLPSTIEYLDALLSSTGKSRSEIVKIKNGGSNPGTWFCQKLTIRFAQWLSVTFSVWVDTKIEDLLNTGKAEIVPMSPAEMKRQVFKMLEEEAESLRHQNFLLSSAKELLEVENTELTTTVRQLEPKATMFQAMHEADSEFTTDLIANELGISSARKLNAILEADDIIKYDKSGGKWVLKAKYRGLDYTIDKPREITKKDGTKTIKLWMYWTGPGRIFLHQRYNPKAAA